MALKPKIYLDEEITKRIKEVWKQQFKKKKVKITKMVSISFTLTKINKGIKSLKQEVHDLKGSMEFMRNDLEQKVGDVEKTSV